jgi:hypothetical protein
MIDMRSTTLKEDEKSYEASVLEISGDGSLES